MRQHRLIIKFTGGLFYYRPVENYKFIHDERPERERKKMLSTSAISSIRSITQHPGFFGFLSTSSLLQLPYVLSPSVNFVSCSKCYLLIRHDVILYRGHANHHFANDLRQYA